MKLNEEYPQLGHGILKYPLLTLQSGDVAAQQILSEMHSAEYKNVEQRRLVTIPSVHVRIFSLPVCEPVIRQELPSTKDVGNFLCILGTVVKTTSPKLLEYSRKYKCSICGQPFDIEAPVEKYHAFPKKVSTCPNLCIDGNLTVMEDQKEQQNKKFSKFKDYQEIKLQVKQLVAQY